ncbi:hypothetical protein Tco_0030808 [Tanacetum coccineum]
MRIQPTNHPLQGLTRLILEVTETFLVPNTKYASKIVKKYGLHSTDSVNTSMIENKKLDEDLQGKQVDATLYRGMIGPLMYLTASRPDLNYVVCLCARSLCTVITRVQLLYAATMFNIQELSTSIFATFHKGASGEWNLGAILCLD